MKFDKKKLSKKFLVEAYRQLVTPRLIEEKMLILLRQGKITKWFSGIGQEAVSVGVSLALKEDEYILPMHRNLGVFTSRGISLNRLFGQFQGKLSGFTKGRDRSFHFGSKEHHIVGMISHLGPQMAVASGIALAEKLADANKVSAVFCGEGGASEGDFHEALNVAAVWNLPVIFIVENNGYGLSTPTSEQYKMKNFTDKGPAYGIDAHRVDGNNVLEVYQLVSQLAKNMRRNPKPVLIEAVTFRMRGHEEASGTKYVPEELFKKWAKMDPVENYEKFLIKEKLMSQDEVATMVEDIEGEISEAWDLADEEPFSQANLEQEIGDVFAASNSRPDLPTGPTQELRFVDAISQGLDLAMKKFPELVLMGQDIAEYGGVFKVTEGLLDKYGKDRVRNTPLCESAILGIGLGLSVRKQKSMIEMQFADFVTCGFNQIVNNLAKAHYRWGQNADVVVRLPTGAGVGAGPYHSQSTEAWFCHTPGLKVVYPSSPEDAKGLLLAAIEDPNPVLFFEHKKLYRSVKEEVSESYYTTPIGKGLIVNEGEDATIVTYGAGVHTIKDLISKNDWDVELIDLRSLQPWDKDLVKASVEKTGRLLVLTEDCLTGSITSEIASWISENCFESLDAPVKRVGSLDTPVPFASALEAQFLPFERCEEAVQDLLDY